VSGNDRCPPEVLARTWHEDMIWYGPAAIGASYTIRRYQEQHQYPFREGLTDKVFNGPRLSLSPRGTMRASSAGPTCRTPPRGGFLGLPGGTRADMRSSTSNRRQGDKLAENWVLIDLPYWLGQQGLDVLERTRSILNPS